MRLQHPFHRTHSQQGFTLLELLLVITIISGIAWLTLDVVNNDSDQIRFDETRNRLDAIRRAIIGDTSRTINGSPEIRGYVADMGMLPAHLQDLVAQSVCENVPAGSDTDSANCTTLGGISYITKKTYGYYNQSDPNTTNTNSSGTTTTSPQYTGYSMLLGWHGPYLQAAELLTYPKFLDGWGNNDETANNFGWVYTIPSAGSPPYDVTVQSIGRDGVAGGSTTDIYEVEYPPATSPLIRENEYQVLITTDGPTTTDPNDGTGGIPVSISTAPHCISCTVAFSTTPRNRSQCLADGGTWSLAPSYDVSNCETDSTRGWQDTTISDSACAVLIRKVNGHLDELESVPVSFTWDGSLQTGPFKFVDGTTLFIGEYLFELFWFDGSTSTCTTTPFLSGSVEWKTFSIVPGSALQPLRVGL